MIIICLLKLVNTVKLYIFSQTHGRTVGDGYEKKKKGKLRLVLHRLQLTES